MSLISYKGLCELVESGVIEGVDPKDINAASIDVHLGNKVVTEVFNKTLRPVDIQKREIFPSKTIDISEEPYDLSTNEFILASTREVFNLPDDICAEFKLKSSGARTGLENVKELPSL